MVVLSFRTPVTSLGLYYLASLLFFSSVLVFRWMRRQHDVVVLLDSACPPWILASCVAAAVIVTRPQTHRGIAAFRWRCKTNRFESLVVPLGPSRDGPTRRRPI